MIFLTNISRNKCNTSFRVLLPKKTISDIIFMIPSSSRSKRQFQGQMSKKKNSN